VAAFNIWAASTDHADFRECKVTVWFMSWAFALNMALGNRCLGSV